MTRHPRFHTRTLRAALAALLIGGGGLAEALHAGRAAAQAAPVKPYYLMPCRDQNGDRIEDFLLDAPESDVDLCLVFDAATWNPTTARAQVQAALNLRNSSASIVYVGRWSPYLFLRNVKFGAPKAAPLELQEILTLPNVLGARAYERFVHKATRINIGMTPRPIRGGENPVHGGHDPGELGARLADGLGPQAPAPAPTPTPLPPALLLYFVDSGIDGHDQYWGIDAAQENPLAPKEAHDPQDISPIAHGTFVKQVAWTTLTKGQSGNPAPLAAYADVRVGVAPTAATTTLELTRGFDAIVAHLEAERLQGHLIRPVINVSYDTDGPIANHDIIYPRPEGPLDPRGADVDLAPAGGGARVESAGPASGGPPVLSPCAAPLFDNVYSVLESIYDGVLLVGAGNDGRDAAFVINELGLSTHVALVVSAVEAGTGIPSDYSCFGTAPDGLPQNGHPDLAALGRTGIKGFDYLLEGTSIATAFGSGVVAAALLKSPRLTPAQLLTQLVNRGTPLPDMGQRWYGQALITLPWAPQAPTAVGPAAPGTPATLLFPGSGERLTVIAAGPGPLNIRIFSVAGRLVRTLADGEMSPGRHEVAFDGRAGDGSPLPAGLYFVRAGGSIKGSVTKLLIRR